MHSYGWLEGRTRGGAAVPGFPQTKEWRVLGSGSATPPGPRRGRNVFRFGKGEKEISAFRRAPKIFGFWRGRQIFGFGGACTVGWVSAGSTAWPCSGWGHRCGADYGKFCKTMPRDVQKRQNCPDFVCSQELRCPPRPPLWGVQGDGDCHSVPGRGWGLCGDTPGLGQGHPGPHGEVWVAKVPTVCVCSGRSELS